MEIIKNVEKLKNNDLLVREIIDIDATYIDIESEAGSGISDKIKSNKKKQTNNKLNKYLINHLKKNPNLSLLDLGCATGQLLRYLKLKKVLVDYFGVDISESCIQKAQEIHEKNCFKKITTQNLAKQFDGKNYNIVYSRDTVPHQLEPFKFIKSLIDVAKDTLILRLRTRDLGSWKIFG